MKGGDRGEKGLRNTGEESASWVSLNAVETFEGGLMVSETSEGVIIRGSTDMASTSSGLGRGREYPDGSLEVVLVRVLASEILIALFSRRMIMHAAIRTAIRIATAPAMIPPI